ncbi:hypothetical protein CEDDRAFT_03066 [Frankia sp. CeD]|nr:hypothetical protein CEDDRAFT_03066 [Frankia sp. CeD]
MLPFDDWDPGGGRREPAGPVAVPEEMSTEGADPPVTPTIGPTAGKAVTPRPVGVGGRAAGQPSATPGHNGQRSNGFVPPCKGVRRGIPSPDEWGRVQAAHAPRWSARQRAHAAAMFGLVFPPSGDGSAGAP